MCAIGARLVRDLRDPCGRRVVSQVRERRVDEVQVVIRKN
jgi:hypothetical protein